MHERMAAWSGCQSKTGYEYWAMGRAHKLASAPDRPLKPEDLSIVDRQEWISRLDQCSTLSEAECTVRASTVVSHPRVS